MGYGFGEDGKLEAEPRERVQANDDSTRRQGGGGSEIERKLSLGFSLNLL